MALPTLTVPDLSDQLARLRDLAQSLSPRPVAEEARVDEAPDTYDYAGVVTAGVALLDEKLGRDVWLPRLEPLYSLDLAHEDRCVVARATSRDFRTGAITQLGAPSEGWPGLCVYAWAEPYGFALPDEHVQSLPPCVAYARLTDAWLARAAELRAEVTG